ncbi:pyridoxal phosphate-dependent decarboxylase family protein [Laceyella putida]|uniref:Pyridoxal phosphate-dependent decarboxylase family protein n=1 Tax=Laceyella putida TaxID=110101 RepID=A0ABW2RFA2_9BACL
MRKKPKTLAEHLFLNNSYESRAEYHRAMSHAQQIIYEQFANRPQPFSGIQVQELTSQLDQFEVCPEEGSDLADIITRAGQTILKHSIAVHHPTCSAHLHCPPLIPALAAEAMISASNQSMDSWDQSPAATLLEEKLIRWLCHLYGYTEEADGVFTSGGTQSNFMGLLLARDHYIKERLGWHVQKRGLPPESSKLRILCAKTAHFTVKQSAALLGLGERAVVCVDTDEHMRMCLNDLDQRLNELHAQGLLPFALVATAGSTDFGAIDPISECASRAKHFGMWLHVDAAYGGAVILSDQHKHLLSGIETADSITVDFHKLFYQPISCGAFLTKKAIHFNLMKWNADYLNPEEDERQGIPNLVAKSVQTTRRFDALKLWISMQTIGRAQFAELINHTIELAQKTAQLISEDPQLELINKEPSLNAIVFRYAAQTAANEPAALNKQNQLNQSIRQALLQSGQVVLAQTKVGGMHCLKLTMLNPRMTMEDVKFILHQVKQTGELLELQKGEKEGHAQKHS